MVIDISLELLDRLELSPNEYFSLELIRNKETKILSKFLEENFTSEQITKFFNKLIKLGYITSNSYVENDYGWNNVKLSNTYRQLVKLDDLFEEFVDEYPKSVIRTDGTTDYLRIDLKTARLYYHKYVNGVRARHDHLIRCLQFEVEERKREGSLKFMLRMVKWFNTQAWTAYEDKLLDSRANETVDNTKYGTEIE